MAPRAANELADGRKEPCLRYANGDVFIFLRVLYEVDGAIISPKQQKLVPPYLYASPRTLFSPARSPFSSPFFDQPVRECRHSGSHKWKLVTHRLLYEISAYHRVF